MKRAVIIAAMMFLTCGVAHAADPGWQADIYAGVLNAENRLTIGQSPDATDGVDGKYDIPALLSGDIEAYVVLDGAEYWKDIKAGCAGTCTKAWDVLIESPIEGTVTLSWDPDDIPSGMRVTLTDMGSGKSVDMKAGRSYGYENAGKRTLRVEAQR